MTNCATILLIETVKICTKWLTNNMQQQDSHHQGGDSGSVGEIINVLKSPETPNRRLR